MTSTNPYANETLAERMAREQQEWQEDDDRIRDKASSPFHPISLPASAQGNAAFRAGDLREAYLCYTAVINMNEEWLQPAYAVHWLNRAAVCLRLRAYAHAEADAAQALRRARSAKALYRRGRARRFLGRLGEACLDVREALRLKPEDPDLLDELATRTSRDCRLTYSARPQSGIWTPTRNVDQLIAEHTTTSMSI